MEVRMLKNFFSKGMLGDQSGQDNAEYIVLGVVAVVVALTIFAILRGGLGQQASRIIELINGVN
jgi:hypothetical protein